MRLAATSFLALLFLASLTAFTQTSSPNPPRITFNNIDVPGATATIPTGINNSGTILGIFLDSTGAFHGFLADKTGAFVKSIDFPGAPQTEPSGINELGDLVGS